MADEVRVAIASDADLVTARAEARAMAERLGFPRPDPTLIATAISEVARNIVVHVGRGEIVLEPFEDADRYGLVVIATDDGPGHPRRRRGPARRLQRQGRSRPRAAGGAAPHGRLRDRLRRRHGHDGDHEEVAVPRRARTPARGAPPPWLSPRRESRSNGRVAIRCRRWRSDERRPRGRQRSCRRACSWRGSTAWGTATRPPAPPSRAAEVMRESPSADLVLLVRALPRRAARARAARRSAWPSSPPPSAG